MMNQDPRDVDDIDVSVAKFKRRRAEQGLYVYCGDKLGDIRSPAQWAGPVCQSFHNEMYPT